MVESKTARRVPRYTLTVDAEITDMASNALIKTRTKTLSPFGCGVKSSTLFPIGSIVRPKLSHEGAVARVGAIVVYSSPDLGMGFTFSSVELEDEQILARWIVEYLLGVKSSC